MRTDLPRRILVPLGSLPVTLVCLLLMMVLVLCGTLAQTAIGTFAAQREYFNQWFVWSDLGGTRIPLLPGGLTVGTAWLVNLVAAFIVRFRWRREDAGILISHFGLILLVAGQGLTQLTAIESQMPIQEGATAWYSESLTETELAVTTSAGPDADEVVSVPRSLFRRPGTIRVPQLPFDMRVLRYLRHADLRMGAGGTATQGIGTQVTVRELPPVTSDNERDLNTAYVEVRRGEESLGVWLLSLAFGAPQSLQVDGKDYRLQIRPKRIYYPYSITLKDFRHDLYPGTAIPKNFSSLVTIDNPATGEKRDALIYMNHPLRYRGSTFFQASFGNDNTLSVFQVVQNPVWLTPYISCALVVLGLALQFLVRLSMFARSRRPR